MSVEMNVPEVRFKGFSGEWQSKTIAELIDDELIYPPKDGNHGNIHPKTTDYVEYGIPFIMANNIRGGKIQFHDCNHISLDQAETLQKGFAKTGDILLTHKGTVGEVAVVPETGLPYLMLTPQVTYYRTCGTSGLDTYFLATSFVTNSFQAPLKQEAGGGTRAYLGITAQQKLSISVPPEFDEQTAIGNTFQKLDNLINQHQQKHDKLSNIKKAMLGKMFPKQGETIPEIRFKGFCGEWDEKELKEISTYHSSTLTANDAGSEGQYELYDAQKCIGYTDKNIQDSDYITIIKDGSGVGRVRVLPKNTSFIATMGAIKPKESNLHFLYCCITKIDFNKHISGATIPHVYFRDYGREKFRIPKFEEQTAIGNYFQKLDALINQHQQQITKLNNIKQACLSKMFV